MKTNTGLEKRLLQMLLDPLCSALFIIALLCPAFASAGGSIKKERGYFTVLLMEGDL